MSDETLKPCPFCGSDGDDIEVERVGTSRVSCIVSCNWCGARREGGAEGPDSPARTWNDRPGEARIRAEAAAERTREIVLGLHEDAGSWRTMAAKMVKDEDRLMCDRRASVLEGRAYAIAARYGVDGDPADAFPKPGGAK